MEGKIRLLLRVGGKLNVLYNWKFTTVNAIRVIAREKLLHTVERQSIWIVANWK